MINELKHGDRVRVIHYPIWDVKDEYIGVVGTINTDLSIVSVSFGNHLSMLHLCDLSGACLYDLTGCVEIVESAKDKQIRKLEETITRAQSQITELKESYND